MIVDVIIILIIVLFLIIGLKRGAAETVLNIAGLIVSMLLAVYAGKLISEFIYTQYISGPFILNLEQAVEDGSITSGVINELPYGLSSIISPVLVFFGYEPNETLNLDGITNNFVPIIETAISPLVIDALSFILTIVLFIIILALVKIIIKIALNFFNIPVIKQINMLMGAALGLVEGLIFVFIAVNIYYSIACGAYNEPFSSSFATSYLFNLFCLAV